MSWKNWPYWLKGGIIGLILGFLIQLKAFKIILEIIRYGTCYGENCMENLVYGVPFYLILGFVLGALIGRIIGKIKQR